MTKVNIALTVLLVLCALGLVTSQHRERRIFAELERAQAQGRQLEVRWDQLEVEQSNLTKNSLIDTKARRTLSMTPVTTEQTLHLSLGGDPGRTSTAALGLFDASTSRKPAAAPAPATVINRAGDSAKPARKN